MSWAEVFKINSNMTKPLNTLMTELISSVTTLLNTVNTNVTNTKTQVGNVNTAVGNVNTAVSNVNTAVGAANTKLTQISTQMRDSKVIPMRIITASTTYIPEKTGIYKVICVGEGGDGYTTNGTGYHAEGGSGGGVAIKDIRLVSSQSYPITVEGTTSFSTLLTATAGSNRAGAGGTGTGGDYNYTGEVGEDQDNSTAKKVAKGGGLGVAIVGLTQFSASLASFEDGVSYTLPQSGLMGYGGGGSGIVHLVNDSTTSTDRKVYSQNGQPAAVIIIPVELEE